MHLSSHSVILLAIQLLCIFTGLGASSRDYSGPYFCLEHSPNTGLYQELHSLIPSDKRSCEHVWCLVCNSLRQAEVWWSKYHDYPDIDEDDDDLIDVYTCPCVNYYQYEWGEIARWQSCKKRAIYNGYFAKNHIKFFNCFSEYLDYCFSNQNCKCYWPEVSDPSHALSSFEKILVWKSWKKSSLK